MMLREWSDWGGSVSRRERRKASSVYVVSAVMPCFALMIALTMGWKKSRFLAFHMVQALALQVLAFTAVAVFLSVGALAEGIGFERVRAVLLILARVAAGRRVGSTSRELIERLKKPLPGPSAKGEGRAISNSERALLGNVFVLGTSNSQRSHLGA
jgi:hypothetical protein